MTSLPALLLRALLVVAVTLAGAVFFPFVGLPAWAWARECGGVNWLQGVAYLGPGVASILALDYWVVTRRLTAARALLAVVLAAAVEWVLGIVFFATQWGC